MEANPGALRNLSIRRKTLAGFAAVIGLVGLGNLFGIVSVRQIEGQGTFARDVAYRKVVALTEVESLVKRLGDAVATAVDVGIPEPLTQARALRAEVDAKLGAAEKAFAADTVLASDFSELRRGLDEHLRRGDGLLQLAQDRQWSAFGPPRKELEDSRQSLLRRAEAAKVRCVQELEGALGRIAQLSRRTVSSVAAVTALALVGALSVSVLLSGLIVGPLKRLAAMMERARDGDVSVRAPVESRDETGALSQGFNAMLQEIEGHRHRLEELVEERTAQLETANQQLQTELEVRQITEASLAESEELLRNVLGAVNAGILIVASERREVLEVNAYALKRIGARRQDVVGRRADAYLLPAEGEAAPEAGAAANVRGLLRRADGKTVPVLRSAVPVTHQGRAHLIESFIDVSDTTAPAA